MNKEDIIERFSSNETLNQIIKTGYSLSHNNFDFDWINSQIVDNCLMQWEQPNRYYHGFNHLCRLLGEIDGLVGKFTKKDIEMMEILSLFHDVVYNPKAKDNEIKSIEFISKKLSEDNIDIKSPEIKKIFNDIEFTQYKKEHDFRNLNDNDYLKAFCTMDIGSSCMDEKGDSETSVINREIQLFKEFQFLDFPTYRDKRINFAKRFKYFSDKFKNQVVEFLSSYRPKIGVYPGSFFPFHIGHLNILEQSEKIFDKTIIAVGNNPEKQNNSRLSNVEKALPFHEVAYYDGLLSEYLKTLSYADVTVIRGLRTGHDLEYEMQQLRTLEDFGCNLPVIYFMCSQKTTHISSSMIRGLEKFVEPNEIAYKYLPKKYDYFS